MISGFRENSYLKNILGVYELPTQKSPNNNLRQILSYYFIKFIAEII